jgi:hypothetical protein
MHTQCNCQIKVKLAFFFFFALKKNAAEFIFKIIIMLFSRVVYIIIQFYFILVRTFDKEKNVTYNQQTKQAVKEKEMDLFCKDSPPMTQYCSFFVLSNQTSQEVTHPDTTLAEARLTAEFLKVHGHHGCNNSNFLSRVKWSFTIYG